MKNTTIGNQQGNDIFKIGYILGMIDGEGTISLLRTGKTQTMPLYCKLSPYISITGTDEVIMDITARYCKELELPYHIRISSRGIKHKPAITLTVYGLSRVKKWIDKFKDIYFGKKEKLDLLEEYIYLRTDKVKTHPFKKPYSSREIEIYNTIRMLNERGGKSRHIFTAVNPANSNEKNIIWKRDKMLELINKGWTQIKIAEFFSIDQSSVNKWIKRNIKPSTTTIKTLNE